LDYALSWLVLSCQRQPWQDCKPGGTAQRRWLGEEPDPRDLMRPYPAELMRMWPISTRERTLRTMMSNVEPIGAATLWGARKGCESNK
jgi:hypothetical protein